jgi:hypothetical protein
MEKPMPDKHKPTPLERIDFAKLVVSLGVVECIRRLKVTGYYEEGISHQHKFTEKHNEYVMWLECECGEKRADKFLAASSGERGEGE